MLAKSPITKGIDGFLIDPVAMQITKIKLPGQSRDNLSTMYKAIGCDLVEPVYMNRERDAVFVDEEGLLKNPTMFFYIKDFHQPLAGRGVVVGCDSEGETISPRKVTLEWLQANTAFVKMVAPGVTEVAAPPELVGRVTQFFA